MNPFKEVAALVKINKVLKREGELMRMKLSSTTVCQMILGGCDILNVVTPLTSGNTKVWLGAALAILHIVVNTISHLSNPDGTDVKTAYIPKQE